MIILKQFKSIFLAATLILLAACNPDGDTSGEPTPARIEVSPTVQAAAVPPTNQPPPTETLPPATATAVPEPTDTAVPLDMSIAVDDVTIFPIPFIISGDRVTFQVHPQVPQEIPVNEVDVEIFVDEERISTGKLSSRSWGGRAEGIYEWVWDTKTLFGEYMVRIVLDGEDLIQEGDHISENNEITFPVKVRRIGDRPLEERDAAWVTSSTECCNVTILTRTAAYRDFPDLLDAVEQAVSQAAIMLQEEPDEKINVYFIDRTIGQGGFAGSEMAVTYVDRPYAGGELHELLVHEAVHVIDRQFAPQRISFLAEGTAVWAAGGHYKAEDLDRRTAALLALRKYIPLEQLADNFYPSQHEIGYLEAGAFVSYLIDQFGYPTFREFYADTSASDGSSISDSLDLNLKEYYGMSLKNLETEWLDHLQSIPIDDADSADLETTIRYYETMRRYQEIYDPTAHYLNAWLPNPVDVHERGNPADFIRHPREEINVTIEVMLKSAEAALLEQEYVRSNVILDSVDRILAENGTFVDPLSISYQAIVQVATAFGYEVQDIDLEGDTANVLATTSSGISLIDLDFERRRGDWILKS